MLDRGGGGGAMRSGCAPGGRKGLKILSQDTLTSSSLSSGRDIISTGRLGWHERKTSTVQTRDVAENHTVGGTGSFGGRQLLEWSNKGRRVDECRVPFAKSWGEGGCRILQGNICPAVWRIACARFKHEKELKKVILHFDAAFKKQQQSYLVFLCREYAVLEIKLGSMKKNLKQENSPGKLPNGGYNLLGY